MSFTCVNCGRGVLSGLIPFGHEMASVVRVPPKCEAMSLVYFSGVSPAQAQPWYARGSPHIPPSDATETLAGPAECFPTNPRYPASASALHQQESSLAPSVEQRFPRA